MMTFAERRDAARMTATERLRQLLDERGVEWWEDAFSSKYRTVFDGKDGVRYCVHQLGSSLFISSILSVTPEQAIAVTLGRGTCEVVRCRDCKHYTEDEMEYYHYCGNWCEQVDPNGFCAWGERRDES